MAQSASEMEVRLEAGAAMSSRVGALSPMSMMALTPGLRYANRRFAINARGAAWLAGEQWHLADALVTSEAHTPSFLGIRAEILANASRLMVDPANPSQQLDASGRLHLIREGRGMWLGSGVVRPLRIATVSNVNVSSGGVWTKLGAATLRATVTNFLFTKIASNDTVTVAEAVTACPVAPEPVAPSPALDPGLSAMTLASGSTSCRRESRLTDLEGEVRWEHRLARVSMRGGQRFGGRVDVTPESRTWASAQAAVSISSQLAAVVGGGREPAQPMRGLPARTFASLGLMVAYWPITRSAVLVATPASLVRAFELRPAGVALQRLTARIGGVESVEIMGDFTDWAAMHLVRRGRDQWELLIPMSPGVHHINLRIDGGKWIAPPGVPTIRDDFNGEVGVLVIKQ